MCSRNIVDQIFGERKSKRTFHRFQRSSRSDSQQKPRSGGALHAGWPRGSTPLERLQWSLQHDEKWRSEVNLGRRIGLYRIKGELGAGNFSQVKMGIHQLTGERVAIKIVDKSKLEPKTQRMLNREIATMDSLRHPHIIRLYEVIETLGRIHLVMEYASGGELFAHITAEGQLPEPEAKKVFAQVVGAVQHMHKQNIIHRDIKAENVFLASNGTVKVGDLGFSTRVQSAKDSKLTTFCGSPPYAAPELFRDSSYTGPQVDVWALGVLLHFIVSAALPFRASTVVALKEKILDGSFSDPDGVSKPCLDLIRGMLEKSPKDRMTIERICSSRWLSGTEIPTAGGPEFWSTPTVIPDSETTDVKIPALEAKARERLEELGVAEVMLIEHATNGARSPLIGAYRIVVHMYLRNAEEEAAKLEAEKLKAESNGNETSKKGKNKKENCVSGHFRNRCGSGGTNCVSLGNGNSKTCVIF
ncbi:serine/threonine-protein kinase NIM1 isoform X2 [Ischnura elegans]|uniref:serine/threonine-protein kinase NIM1 isoform X2 n=1 Tax=Ischnura elegans TaxID=197161 RepID=UPI001ED86BF3|nr:serine/threonine-protein kinase NIM1 isoform X2 [Ischnura elegans]